MRAFERMIRAQSIRHIRQELARLDVALCYDAAIGGFYLATQTCVIEEDNVDPCNLDTEEITTVIDIVEDYNYHKVAVAI